MGHDVNARDLFRAQLALEGLRFDAEGHIERWRDMPGESGPPPRVVAVDFGSERAVFLGTGLDRNLEESILAMPVQALLAGAPEVLDFLSTEQAVERSDEYWTYSTSPDAALPACPLVREVVAGEELRRGPGMGDGSLYKGVAFVVLVGGVTVSEAQSVREDESSAELWVHTDPSHRRRGYATQTASAWFRSTMERRLVPFYSHEKTNVASRNLAEALGLRRVYVLSAYA